MKARKSSLIATLILDVILAFLISYFTYANVDPSIYHQFKALFTLISTSYYLVPLLVINHVLMPFLIVQKRYLYAAVSMLLLPLVWLFPGYYLITYSNSFFSKPIDIETTVLGNYLELFFVCLVDLSFMLGIDRFQQIKQKELITKEKLEAENSYLRLQVNPHLIFNTLNNVYGLIDINKVKAKEMVMAFSEIMQFTTYESRKELIEVAKEIEFIEAFIELQRIRSSVAQIHFIKSISNDCKFIPPFLIIPIIENAFKHGMQNFVLNPNIRISIILKQGVLKVITYNRFCAQNDNKYNESSGFGLKNLRARLDNLFPSKYTLDSKSKNNVYFCCLSIKL
jgi:sensor histidine kinase YesM